MPFPTWQGTQAAVRSMLDALVTEGHKAHLLSYGEAAFSEEFRFPVHRTSTLPGLPSFRSGPSLRKVAYDSQILGRLLMLRRSVRPRLYVAHHVEAAIACLAARVHPTLFIAHTALGPELPTYAHPRFATALESLGRSADHWLCKRADAAAAITPMLADRLGRWTGRPVEYLPLPWLLPAPITAGEREAARAFFGFDENTPVLLYAGNLDAYQGWERVIDACARLSRKFPATRLLIATECEPAPIWAEAGMAGILDHVRITNLAGERERRMAHAAADMAVVPRRTTGGLPIKLLDALARGVPVLTCYRGAAGLPLDGAALVVRDDDSEAMAAAAGSILRSKVALRSIASHGRSYVRKHHSGPAFVDELDRIARSCRGAG
jgi:glycosyltransferase involved in cell wall biosynthesis